MSDEVTTECSICGHIPGPFKGCEVGCDGNPRFTQSRAFTQSEERLNARSDPDRYGRTGNVNPKIVSLPGSGSPGQT